MTRVLIQRPTKVYRRSYNLLFKCYELWKVENERRIAQSLHNMNIRSPIVIIIIIIVYGHPPIYIIISIILCRIYCNTYDIFYTRSHTDLLSCSIGLSWVNFVSPMGLGCWCSRWWWLSILGSPDTAALGWCGPRWNPTAMPSSNSSASTAPLMLYIIIKYIVRVCPFLVVYSLYLLFLCAYDGAFFFFISILFHFIIHYPLNGIMFSRATDALQLGLAHRAPHAREPAICKFDLLGKRTTVISRPTWTQRGPITTRLQWRRWRQR